jgi:hypothetical protein
MEYVSIKKAKPLIQDGDIILVCKSKTTGFMGKAISFVEKADVYHAGLAVWLTLPNGIKELFIAEADTSGTCLTNLAQYHREWLRVLAKPDYVKNNSYYRELFAMLGSTKYSFKKSLWSAVRQYIRLPDLNDKGVFCSELVAKCWKKGGFQLKDTEIDPKQLEQNLLQRGVQYRCWIMPHERYIRKSK